MSTVPPFWMMPPTSRGPSSTTSPVMRPSKPRRTPLTCRPLLRAVRTTARTHGFMPGASPPEVIRAIVLNMALERVDFDGAGAQQLVQQTLEIRAEAGGVVGEAKLVAALVVVGHGKLEV